MPVRQITDAISTVGILNPIMRIFDVVMRTDYGTTYNSYIVRGKDKTALIETCHLTYFDQYLENIRAVCPPEEIDYIILNHCEPDHTGVMARLTELCPHAEILVSQAGSLYIRHITNNPDLPVRVVKDGETLDLGGHTLQFRMAPFLHWPDSMFTWCAEDKTLFSCDFFGSHYCEPHVFDTAIKYPAKYRDALKGYYDAIFGPFKPYVLKGIEKINDLDISFICTSHGPVLTKEGLIGDVIEQYRQWSQSVQKTGRDIPVFFCSAYGNTSLLAEAIAAGIRETLPDARVTVYDINDHDMAYLQAQLNESDAFAIGSPTINSDAVPPVWHLLSGVDAINNKKKPALVFGSFGWSGEAIPGIIARLKGLRMAVFEDGYKINFVPVQADLDEATALGRRFAESL